MRRFRWTQGRSPLTPPRKADRFARWELALLIALAAVLLQGALCPEAAAFQWWTVMFPGLSEAPGGWAETAAAGEASGYEVRWWLAELLRRLFG